MDRAAWWVTVHGITKSWTGLTEWLTLSLFFSLMPASHSYVFPSTPSWQSPVRSLFPWYCFWLVSAALLHLVVQGKTQALLLQSITNVYLQNNPSDFRPALGTSVQFSPSVMSDLLQPHGLEHARLPCPSPTPGDYSNSCPFSRWCHSTNESSIIPLSSCLQSFPASGSFQMSQFFASDGQSIGVVASVSVLPMNIQDWFPLGWTGWNSLRSKALSSVFSNTTVQKRQFFSVQLSLESNSHIDTWLLEKPSFDLCWQSNVSTF